MSMLNCKGFRLKLRRSKVEVNDSMNVLCQAMYISFVMCYSTVDTETTGSWPVLIANQGNVRVTSLRVGNKNIKSSGVE